MRKSTLFISAVLTTFMLAILFGVVSAYKEVLTVTQEEQAATDVVTDAPVALTDAPVDPTQAAVLTPEQAATLAAQILGRTDLYSVETSLFNGASAYLVMFLTGDQVYVSPQGMILSVVAATPTAAPVYVSNPSKNNNGRPRGGGGGGGGGGGDDDDHGDD